MRKIKFSILELILYAFMIGITSIMITVDVLLGKFNALSIVVLLWFIFWLFFAGHTYKKLIYLIDYYIKDEYK